MSKRKDVEAKTEELVMPLIDEKGFEFVDTEFVKEGNSYYLRVFVDKPGGITIDDLESVSRPLSDKLD
ncbi:MAG TPA: ribosome maturation factor RimP, partial [Eubacterium sp.]|nr:ribosome maturation factor RimP [Eubacterium sp.]